MAQVIEFVPGYSFWSAWLIHGCAGRLRFNSLKLVITTLGFVFWLAESPECARFERSRRPGDEIPEAYLDR